jgi:hypothetical protein
LLLSVYFEESTKHAMAQSGKSSTPPGYEVEFEVDEEDD